MVDPRYIEYALSWMDEEYGSVLNFIREELDELRVDAELVRQAPVHIQIESRDCRLCSIEDIRKSRIGRRSGRPRPPRRCTSRQFAKAAFCSDLPGGCGADGNLVRLVGYRIVRGSGKAPAVRDPPEERMSIEQRSHDYPPSQADSSFSGSGSKKPAHLADLIAFQVSDRAAYVTGQTIAADGGLMSHMPYHAQMRPEQGAASGNTVGPAGDTVETSSDRKERVSEAIRKKYGR